MPPFENQPRNQGLKNEKVKKIFSPETILLGEKFLARRKTVSLSLSYTERLDKTANALGYTNGYADISPEVRSWVATEDAGRKRERADETKIIEDKTFKDRIAANVTKMEKDWRERFDIDPDFQRAMTHPEDGAIPPEGFK